MGLEEMDSEVRDSDEIDLGGLVELPNVEYRLGEDRLGGLRDNRLRGSGLGDKESDAIDWETAG